MVEGDCDDDDDGRDDGDGRGDSGDQVRGLASTYLTTSSMLFLYIPSNFSAGKPMAMMLVQMSGQSCQGDNTSLVRRKYHFWLRLKSLKVNVVVND